MKGESDGLGIATGKASSRGHPSHFTYGVYGVLLWLYGHNPSRVYVKKNKQQKKKKQSQGGHSRQQRGNVWCLKSFQRYIRNEPTRCAVSSSCQAHGSGWTNEERGN